MKKFIFAFIAMFMLAAFSNAQETHFVDLSSKISKELKGQANTKSKILSINEYSEKYGGNIEIKYYEDKTSEYGFKIVSIGISKLNQRSSTQTSPSTSTSEGCPDGYRACARGCNDKPTTAGVVLCVGYCIIDCSGL